MTHAERAAADVPSNSEERVAGKWHLPRRDFVLLPLIFIMTIVVLLAGGEAAARLMYVQADEGDPCLYSTISGPRHRPFCSSRDKVWDGPWVTQQYNACGYRTAEPCTPRPPGALRVVVLGSSVAQGSKVDYADSFAARSSSALSDQCGSLVDFQNLGSSGEVLDRIDVKIPEALALHPSAIVMMIGAHDLTYLKDESPPERKQQERPGWLNPHAVLSALQDSRLFLVVKGQLYRDPAFQIRGFLQKGAVGDYVRTPLNEQWQQRIRDLGDLLSRITALTAPAQVPVLLFFFAERPHVALAAEAPARPGIDPLALSEALGVEAAKYGVRFFDTTRALAKAPNFQSLYYVTDGHPRPAGHAVLASVVQQALLSEPAFARCTRVGSSP